MTQSLLDDTRPIRLITFHGIDAPFYEVGRLGVTRIEAYKENGEMAPVPWFAIYKGDVLAYRANGKHIDAVAYA